MAGIQSVLVIIGAFLFQAVIAPHISIMGTKPDIILIITALYGFSHGPIIGTAAGFSGGLLGDLLAGPHVGLGLISKSIVGFFSGLIQRTIFVENILLPMVAIFVATWLNEFVYVSFIYLVGDTIPMKLLLLKIILPTSIYNAVLTPFIYALVRRFLVFKQDTPDVRIAGKYY